MKKELSNFIYESIVKNINNSQIQIDNIMLYTNGVIVIQSNKTQIELKCKITMRGWKWTYQN